MKRALFLLLPVLFLAGSAQGADLNLAWDPAAGAASYKIQLSTDQGASWAVERAVPIASGTTFTWTGAPDTGLLLFRAISVNAQGQAIRTEAGVWYNGAWKVPPAPGSFGVR